MKFSHLSFSQLILISLLIWFPFPTIQVNLNFVISIGPNVSSTSVITDGILSGINELVNRSSTKFNISPILLAPTSLELVSVNSLCSNRSVGQLTVILDIEETSPENVSQSDSNKSDQLKLFARKMQIPMITVSPLCPSETRSKWLNLDQMESQYLINFLSPMTILMRSLIDIIDHLQITNGHVFYEAEMAYYVPCLKKELTLTNFTFQSITSFDGFSNNGTHSMVYDLVRSKVINYVTIGRSSFINKMIETYRRHDLFKQPYKLIVLSKDGDKIKCFSCKHGQLIIGQPLMSPVSDYDEPLKSTHFHPNKLQPKDVYEFYYYHDLTHLILRSIEISISSGHYFNVTVENRTVRKKDEEYSCWSNLSSQDGSGYKKLAPIALSNSMRGYGEENYGKLGPFRLTQMDQANNQLTGYQEISIRLKKQKYFADYSDIETLVEWESGLPYGRIYYTAKQSEDSGSSDPMKIGVFQTPPFIIKRVNGSKTIYEGLFIDLFNEIVRRFDGKFPEYEFVETSEESIGTLSEPSEDEEEPEIPAFTGLMETMYSGDTYDFILAPVEITEDRQLAVDFSEPVFDLIGFSILMKKPIKESHVWKFITVLEADVWLCITAAYFFTSILLSIFDRYSPYSYRNRPQKYESESPECKKVFTLKESLWFCFISLTPQGGGDAPKCISGRLVAAIWWLFGFIFVASYTANLAAFLTVSRLENRVDTMDGLARQYKIRYAPIENSASDAYFMKMAYIEDKYYDIWKNLSLDDNISEDERANLAVWEYPVSDKYTKIKAQIVEVGKPNSLEDGFRRVRESTSAAEGFALISSSLDVQYLAYLHCDVYKAGDEWAFHPIAFPITKKSSHTLKPIIDPIIRQLKADGFITSLRVKYWEDNPGRKTCPDWRKLSNGLVLTDTWGMFLILLIGITMTLIIISVENCFITFTSARKPFSPPPKMNQKPLAKKMIK